MMCKKCHNKEATRRGLCNECRRAIIEAERRSHIDKEEMNGPEENTGQYPW